MPVPLFVFVKNLETSMTDPFEDAVRDALRGATSGHNELPTYHGAWQRGRRRRLIKRSALAAAGAVVLVAALTVNLGRLPGGEPGESSDVASSAEAATPEFEPTPLATTAPIEAPTMPDPQDAADSTGPVAEPTTPAGTPDPAPSPTEMPPAPAAPAATVPPIAASPTAVPSIAVSPTVVPPTVAPETAVPPTSVPATPVPTVQAEAVTPTPAVVAAPTTDPTTDQDPGSAAGTAQPPADPGSPDGSLVGPEVAFTTGAPADAVLLAGAARGEALPCDLDYDGVADATCELLPDYVCTGDGDVRPGYSAVDNDGDQVVDTCTALDLTICDVDNDGRGDTPCIIDVSVPQDR